MFGKSRKKQRGDFLLILCFLIAQSAFAQTTADEIETLLETPAVTYAQAARFVLEAADVSAIRDPAQAFEYAEQRGWLPKNAAANDTARLDGIALLVMRSFDMKGGVFYSIAKSPHHAYRELAYQKIIQGRTDPAMPVSGDDLLYITGRLMPQTAVSQPPAEQTALAREINTQLEELNVAEVSASVTDKGIMINISNIQFLADSAVLTEPEKKRIREIAGILSAIPGKIQVAGHTALAGSEENSFSLSLERAQSVAVYLVSLRARRAGEITTLGYGSDRPIADNATAEGRAANRRVEITILDN